MIFCYYFLNYIYNLCPYRTPRNIIESDISSIENEKDDLDNNKQGNMEILPPGPAEQIFDDHCRLSCLDINKSTPWFDIDIQVYEYS